MKEEEERERREKSKEVESVEIQDNLSISEIIARKYTRKVHKIRTPEEAAKLLIKDTKQFDVNSADYSEGSKEE